MAAGEIGLKPVDAVEATGFRAVAEVVSRFPGRYLASSVGTRFDFEAPTA